MAGSELARKLKLKPGARAAVIGAPQGHLAEMEPLPEGVSPGTRLAGPLDWLQLFVTTRAELAKLAAKATAALKPEALLWISFPKGSSGIQTDLSRCVREPHLVGLCLAALPPRGTPAGGALARPSDGRPATAVLRDILRPSLQLPRPA